MAQLELFAEKPQTKVIPAPPLPASVPTTNDSTYLAPWLPMPVLPAYATMTYAEALATPLRTSKTDEALRIVEYVESYRLAHANATANSLRARLDTSGIVLTPDDGGVLVIDIIAPGHPGFHLFSEEDGTPTTETVVKVEMSHHCFRFYHLRELRLPSGEPWTTEAAGNAA